MAFDLRNFLFHSGYPIDKVIKIMSGSYTILNSGQLSPTSNIPHGLPGRPLAITVFSNFSDFRDTNDEGLTPYVADGDYGITARTNATNLSITGWSLNGSNRTIYWRAALLEASDTSMEIPGTASSADIFQFNTDYNYSKLVREGIATSNQTVTYDLGFIPQTMLWADTGSFAERITFIDNSNKAAELYSDRIVLRPGSTGIGGANKIHYRIYGDD